MQSWYLPILLLIPAAGALLCAMLPAKISQAWAMCVSLATLLVGVFILVTYPPGTPGWQFTFNNPAIALPNIGMSFSLGIDTISLWLVMLTVLLTPLAIAASSPGIKVRVREYYSWMLLLLAAMLGVFVARDLLVFYLFFELTLIPMFFIIGIWGGPQRSFAAAKFFIFMFAGSILTLAGVIYIGVQAGSFDMDQLASFAQNGLTETQRFWVLLALLAGFTVKIPLFPLHTWLPLAHTEAPTAGSVILAGVLLKLGTYGMIRLVLPIGLMTHDGFVFPGTIHFLGWMCVIGIIYGALAAWVQQDIKKIVAYSSVSHLGFCILGLLALNTQGIEGSVLYMINHGLSTGAMFLVIGMIYDRYHTRDINQLSGLVQRMPVLAFFFVLFVLASIGLPGLNGFVSEFLTILGAFTSEHLGIPFAVPAALGIILGALYMLHMTARVIFGPLKTPDMHGGDTASHLHTASHVHTDSDDTPGDINAKEVGILIPLAIAVVFLGVYPTSILQTMEQPAEALQQPISLPTGTPAIAAAHAVQPVTAVAVNKAP